jgi:hypothetical protein
MNYLVRCLKCGAQWWQRGTYESDTNACCLDDNQKSEGMCNCGDAVEVINEEPIDFEDNYL